MIKKLSSAALVVLFQCLFVLMAEAQPILPFQNPNLSVRERVDDLVSRMTLDEKVSQMVHEAPAIDRLRIPQYNWWNECLHGVARAGIATVFPQAIGLGAAWDEDLHHRIATAISDEARAKHHRYVSLGKRLIYEGLTFWTPNINLFRDPRWGRGQETYGEDPFLTGRLAVQFVKGLQGNDPRYLKTVATVKHYAVHSGPEPERHSFNAVTDDRDLQETYLPHFRTSIVESRAHSVMCAYNRYMGDACCGSNRLLNDILRNEWGFDGYVVSDCGAIRDIFMGHNLVQTSAEASALAVKSGCDLCCGSEYASLKEAVERGLISEKDIDTAVGRLMTARFKLGMFDPPEQVPYSKIPYRVVNSRKHQKLALEAARKAIVLLKNENNLLPLSKRIKTIAVIGPNADDAISLLGNYYGTPFDPVTPLRGIREKVSSGTKVLYARGCDFAQDFPSFDVVPNGALFTEINGRIQNGLKAEYFNNRELKGSPSCIRVDPQIDFHWFDGAPRKDFDGDNFSVRWTGTLVPDRTGWYRLASFCTVNYRLWLGDSLLARSNFRFRGESADARLQATKAIELRAGEKYKLVVEMAEFYGDAQFNLLWSRPAPGMEQEALDAARQADAVVLVCGLSPRLEGEEMRVNVEGFRGGDRLTLDLPAVQQHLMQSIHALGKPVVLVLLNGSAVSIGWAKENIPAIVEAWYPGQAGGAAVADVLFGDFNPGGRLPVTFYRSVDQLPPFEEYAMTGRTYRFFTGEPLYPFGYGLSYTSFRYNRLLMEKPSVPAAMPGGVLNVLVDVENTGTRDGDEVVQLYVKRPAASPGTPLQELKGFRRIHLKKGKRAQTTIPIKTDDLAVYDTDKKQSVLLPGEYRVMAGSSSRDIRLETSFFVVF